LLKIVELTVKYLYFNVSDHRRLFGKRLFMIFINWFNYWWNIYDW